MTGDNNKSFWRSLLAIGHPAPHAAASSENTQDSGVTEIDINGTYQGPSIAYSNDPNTGWTITSSINVGSTYYHAESEEMTKIKKIEKDIEAIKDRLSILDEPSPEKLEQHKMLREAYEKYKMIEKLIGEKHVRNQ